MMNWLPEHSAALQDLRARGLSYSEIADTINATFNTAYTRNAALSRAQRMGMAGLDRPEPSLPGHLEPPKPVLPESSRIGRLRDGQAEPKFDLLRCPKIFTEPVEMPQLRCAAVAPRHLSLLDLQPGDCRYPYGGDTDGETMTFCGHPRRPGSSYCSPHFHLSRDSAASARPVLNDAWLQAVGAI
ncbi:GcrA family cell cycle regulator [Bradyrhizobium sp. CER78]|uniref:GcrA family cell cycle regulator n=1 Tax=Bradyrhizobium sp. CER78 TaxID=3039162 RepID=UPI00244B3C88|nr:GcrA family cell cycle regulator [Bradyrhizobium sp. CER78]MDH2382292.1 GcrA family cell cycle regulator [Bradyrhizobium sp. CER78]